MKVLLVTIVAGHFTIMNSGTCSSKPVTPAATSAQPAGVKSELADPRAVMEAEIAAIEAEVGHKKENRPMCDRKPTPPPILRPIAVRMRIPAAEAVVAAARAKERVGAETKAEDATDLDCHGKPIKKGGMMRGVGITVVQCYTSDGYLHRLIRKDGMNIFQSEINLLETVTTNDSNVKQYLQNYLNKIDSW